MKADRTIRIQGGLRTVRGLVSEAFANSLCGIRKLSDRGILCSTVSNWLRGIASTLLFALPMGGFPQLQVGKPDNDGLSPQQTIRVNVNLVTVGVLVTGGKNRGIEGLKTNDFSILEDGKRQEIVSFSAAEEQAISVVVLLDKSNSMAEAMKMSEAKAAAMALVGASHPANELAFFVFHHEASRITNFTADHDRVKSAISKTVAERGGSSPYDALIEALEYLAQAKNPRQAVVMITDGADQHSSHTLDDVIRAVQVSQAQTYLIGYFSPAEDDIFQYSGKTVTLMSGREIDNPRFVFKRLAEESGAACFFPKSESDLKQAIDTISQDLLQQYTLAYYSSNPAKDSAYRHIEVKVNRRGAKIRARNGYRLPGDSEETTQAATIKTIALPPDAPSRPQIKPFEGNLEHEEGRLIYREDFSNPASGWPNKSGFFYDQGEYHITKAGSAAANGPWLKDLRASLTVRLSAGTSKKDQPLEIVAIGPITPGVLPIQIKESLPGAGLVFRLNELGYYAFLISGSSASQRAYYKLVRKDIKSSVVTDLTPWTPEWAPPSAGASQKKLSVNCRGDFIQLYISDKLVGSVHDDHLKDGMTGMILFGQGQAFFDDMFVEELP